MAADEATGLPDGPGLPGRTTEPRQPSSSSAAGGGGEASPPSLGDRLKRTAVTAARLPQAGAAGYRRSPAAQRAALHMTSSFAVTLAASRGLNFVRERVTWPADELRRMAGRTNPYWGGESFIAAQALLATLASAGLSVVFVHRGRQAAASDTD